MVDAHRAGCLYIVSTPIGNLSDLSPRAEETLRTVSLILAEDTRHSRRLLDHVGIRTPVRSHHEHNEARTTPGLVARLREGARIALISDAGTPLLSDPGARLVRAAIDAGIEVAPVPGPSALLAALVASGLPAERFTFFGFLPRRGSERDRTLEELRGLRHTAILYEAPGRLAATLRELAGPPEDAARNAPEDDGGGVAGQSPASAGAGRPVAVAREMTKQFEEVRRGTLGDLARYYEASPPRGEVVIVLGAAGARELDESAARDRARDLLAGGASTRDVARRLVAELGLPRNRAYRLAQES